LNKVVSNATPLIYLAKIGKLEFLRNTFDEVIIPEEVRKEVVDKGKQLKHTDAFLIEKAIDEGWLKVARTDLLKSPIDMGIGELAVISLAKKLNVKEVLIDETPARTAAKLLDLEARGTIFVLLNALQKKKANLEEFLDLLQQLILQGFRLGEGVYLDAIRQARRMATRDD